MIYLFRLNKGNFADKLERYEYLGTRDNQGSQALKSWVFNNF